MARQISRVISILIEEHFGSPARQVVESILKRGMSSLTEITADTSLQLGVVKRVLCILIRQDMVAYNDDSKFALFSANLYKMYLIARYPRFLSLMREEFDETAELIISQLLIHGYLSIEELVDNITTNRSSKQPAQELENQLKTLQNTFLFMIDHRYVVKVKQQAEVIEELEAQVGDDMESRAVSGGVKRSVITAEVNESKRQRLEIERGKPVDEKQAGLWCVNFEHFHEKLRDKLISQYIATIHTSQLSSIMNTIHAILELDPDTSIKQKHSREVYIPQIQAQLSLSREELRHSLEKVSHDEHGLLARASEGGGGAYVIDYNACYELLLSNTIESIIEERYGCKALRVIKNLQRKKFLEMSQLSECTLIPPQELHDIMSRLYRENMVSLQEVPRLEEYVPGKTFYLYYFDVDKVRRILLDRAFQIIGNMIVKRRTVFEESERVLQKEERVSELLGEAGGAATAEQLDEIEQLLTPGEKLEARNSRMMLERLEVAEVFIDESIFILSHFHAFS